MTKSETRNPNQTRNSKPEFADGHFRHSNFAFDSDFELRHSGLSRPPTASRRKGTGRACIESLEGRELLAEVGSAGLYGTYYNNTNFTGTQVSRTDATVSFNWNTRAPAPNIGSETFVVRWTGKIRPAFSETYTFKTISDDGVRLWIDHKPVIANWGQTGVATNSGTIALQAGKRYDIMLEYREKTGAAQVELRWSSLSTPESVVPSTRLSPEQADLADKIDHMFAFAGGQLKQTIADMGRVDRYPEVTNPDGTWKTVSYNDWTAGFFAGALWQMQQRTAEKQWRLDATAFTKSLEPAKSAGDDLGFRFVPSYGGLYRAMSRKEDRLVMVAAAQSKLANFNSTVGMFESVNFKPPVSTDPRANFPVLMDHTMDLELLYITSRMQTRPDWADKANSHLTRLQQHMVRPDGSTVQWGYFHDQTGQFIAAETRQGINGQSTWSRGQAWGIYSFVTGYEYTGRADFLATAKKMCDYYIANTPPDGVPLWDFDAVPGANTPRDSSAASITASAMLKFASLLSAAGDAAGAGKYKGYAETILGTLLSPAFSAEGTASRGVLLHGVRYFAQGVFDNSLIYGDYYLLEAMNRYGGA